MPVHTVKAGDNLWGIAHKYRVPISSILELNGLNSTKLTPGLALYIPGAEHPMRTYRIKKGDNAAKIASKFNTSISAILKANPGLNPSRLAVGQIVSVPSPIKLPLQTIGFIVPYNVQEFLTHLITFADQLTYIAVAAFSFTDEGFVKVDLDDKEIVARSRELHITPLLMVRNYRQGKFDADLAGRVLGNSTYRRNLVSSVGNIARQRGYGGVSIDIEFIPPERRNDFNTFLRDLKEELGSLILHVNVHAKTEDLPTNRIVGAYDYRAIGNIADFTAVMTIDYGYPGGPAEPISPIWWLSQVVRYSVTQINPRKLLVAFPLYGYDKVTSTRATRALSVQGAQNQAITLGASIHYDQPSQSPGYRYWKGTEEHAVWYEDIRSYIQKLKLLDSYELAGTTLWQLSLPAPQLWAYLKRNVQIMK